MSQLLKKLSTVAEYSDGVFISGGLTSGENERKYFSKFVLRNPHFFNFVDDGRTKIYQLTDGILLRIPITDES